MLRVALAVLVLAASGVSAETIYDEVSLAVTWVPNNPAITEGCDLYGKPPQFEQIQNDCAEPYSGANMWFEHIRQITNGSPYFPFISDTVLVPVVGTEDYQSYLVDWSGPCDSTPGAPFCIVPQGGPAPDPYLSTRYMQPNLSTLSYADQVADTAVLHWFERAGPADQADPPADQADPPAPVPEPGTLLLSASAAVAIAYKMRHRGIHSARSLTRIENLHLPQD